jgi:enterochelin esterase family protein
VLANDVLPAVARAGVPVRRETTIVAGQSYGGLAAAAVVATRPELAATAIVQSGSFHFRADQPPRPPAGQRGELLDALAGRPVPGRHLVQVGTEEGDMLAGARAFHAAAQAGGAHAELDVYAGGHDYAWWRTGLFDALDRLSGTTVADVPE